METVVKVSRSLAHEKFLVVRFQRTVCIRTPCKTHAEHPNLLMKAAVHRPARCAAEQSSWSPGLRGHHWHWDLRRH